MAKARCYCQCHAEARTGDAHELRHRGLNASAWVLEMEALERPAGVDTRDFVACVFACDGCRGFHSPVLDPFPKQSEWTDPPRQPPPATGCDEGEGGE